MAPLSDQPKIKPLFDLMNATGCIQANDACQGECIGRRGIRAPYVSFTTTFEMAQALRRQLADVAVQRRRKEKPLNFTWEIRPEFNWKDELAYDLHCPELDRVAGELLTPFWSMGLWRKKLDSDLTVLASYLRPLLLQMAEGEELTVSNTEMTTVIEPGIKPLCDLMNASGLIQTVASCEGHAENVRFSPYIYFKTSVECAQALMRHIRDICWYKNMMNLDWEITGHFNHEYELMFELRCPALQEASKKFSIYWRWALWRKSVDHDLSVLVAQLAPLLLELGQNNKVNVSKTDKADHQENRADPVVAPLQLALGGALGS